MQGLPGLLGGDPMGFGGPLQPMQQMQQGGYPQQQGPRIGRSSMDNARTASPTHSGLAGIITRIFYASAQ